MSAEDDLEIRKVFYKKKGILYADSLNNRTITITKEEAAILKKKAKEPGIEFKVKPNKILFDKAKNSFYAYDYYIDHDICPFYSNNSCMIYDSRPQICKDFPLGLENQKKLQSKIPRADTIDIAKTLPFEDAVEMAKKEIIYSDL